MNAPYECDTPDCDGEKEVVTPEGYLCRDCADDLGRDVLLADGGERPDECGCWPEMDDRVPPCFPCWMAGFETPNPDRDEQPEDGVDRGERVVADGGREWFAVKSTPTVKEATGPLEERVSIDTREGTVVAEPGDYLIREDDGNVYPIGGEKFGEYYRRIETDGEQDDSDQLGPEERLERLEEAGWLMVGEAAMQHFEGTDDEDQDPTSPESRLREVVKQARLARRELEGHTDEWRHANVAATSAAHALVKLEGHDVLDELEG